ncbi:glucose-6-phosphate isomerase [Petroclostridium sp. X23]|uniref:glucose-6-phosphate isomerase n=1 Tax=Petroclostridium sp. X23 TaxID=3045146 RepID=UPI0024AD559D|nr:glucose-6-phosphate isomerase [Petroclostridium sp. X23]WHH56848.1 glucose-6-phosphate isomerase [Petroclostridium sp. X23]
MRTIALDYSGILRNINEKDIYEMIDSNRDMLSCILHCEGKDSDVLGWVDIDICANELLIREIEQKAAEIREKADVFLLIGVGGSNQGARAVIESMGDGKPEIIYAGNNLSPDYLNRVMNKIKGKSIYVNVIAKNFATLEPGIVFRVVRNYMEEVYGVEEAGKRIIATGSLNNSSLEILGKQKGYTLLPFPLDVGGRYSVLTAVGLLPIAVGGTDIREILAGAKDMKKTIQSAALHENPAVLYGAIRNVLLEKGYHIEILAYFEPLLYYFSKWWVQLFGESEGKDGKGIFPTACSFSEDLHSLGQYIQDGQKIIFETFLHLEDQGAAYTIPSGKEDVDGFAYIEGKDFTYLNEVAYEATVKAHSEGGIPCIVLNIPKLTPYYMGQLFYFFKYACYISGSILGINPFDQPGVEAYKNNMFKVLKPF